MSVVELPADPSVEDFAEAIAALLAEHAEEWWHPMYGEIVSSDRVWRVEKAMANKVTAELDHYGVRVCGAEVAVAARRMALIDAAFHGEPVS